MIPSHLESIAQLRGAIAVEMQHPTLHPGQFMPTMFAAKHPQVSPLVHSKCSSKQPPRCSPCIAHQLLFRQQFLVHGAKTSCAICNAKDGLPHVLLMHKILTNAHYQSFPFASPRRQNHLPLAARPPSPSYHNCSAHFLIRWHFASGFSIYSPHAFCCSSYLADSRTAGQPQLFRSTNQSNPALATNQPDQRLPWRHPFEAACSAP